MLEIIGAPQSSFVRTVRTACEEKGVECPEAREMLDQSKYLGKYFDRHNGRASLQATLPPPFSELTGTSR
jgi:hypothetical protein